MKIALVLPHSSCHRNYTHKSRAHSYDSAFKTEISVSYCAVFFSDPAICIVALFHIITSIVATAGAYNGDGRVANDFEADRLTASSRFFTAA